MGSHVTTDVEVARHELRGRVFTVHRLTWSDTDRLSFDVYDEATGKCLTEEESFDDEPTRRQILDLLERIAFENGTGTLSPYFKDDDLIAILDDVARVKLSREQLLDLLTTAALIGRNEGIPGGTRGEVQEYVERRMQAQLDALTSESGD